MKRNIYPKKNSKAASSCLIRRFLLTVIFIFGLVSINATVKPPETVDKPASELDISITVLDSEKYPSDNRVAVVVQFFYEGRYVNLRSNSSISCNGIALPKEALGYAARVPIQPEGGRYNFIHTREGVSTSVYLTVPGRPVFVSPTAGATVARSTNVIITYVPGNASEVTGRASGHRAGAGTISVGADSQPDNGTYSGLNVTASGGAGEFEPGIGGLSLSRKFLNIHTGGSGFKSVKSDYSSGSKINITWI